MKLNPNSQSGKANVIHSLLLTLMLSISCLLVQPAAAQQIPATRDHDLNPLQVALLKWGPNLTTTFPAGSFPYGVAFDGANIWVANSSGGNVTKLRANDGALQGTFNVGGSPTNVAFDGANIWVTNDSSPNAVIKLRASDGVLQGRFSVGDYPFGIAFDGANVWVTL